MRCFDGQYDSQLPETRLGFSLGRLAVQQRFCERRVSVEPRLLDVLFVRCQCLHCGDGGSLTIAGTVPMLGSLVSRLAQPLSMLLPGRLRLQNGAIAWDLLGPTRCEIISPIEQS